MGAGELPARQRRVVFKQLFPFNGKSGGELWALSQSNLSAIAPTTFRESGESPAQKLA